MKIRTSTLLGLVALGSLALATSSFANTVVLDFEGVGNNAAIGNYYNGGAGGNLGVTFSSNALVSSPRMGAVPAISIIIPLVTRSCFT